MTIVIDASVALKWVLDEPGKAAADALRDEELIAPVLWLAEAANALWRSVRIGQLDKTEADELLSVLFEAPVASLAMEPYLTRALRFAVELDHPVYDCIYLALAELHDTYVVTADRRFAGLGMLPQVKGRVHPLGG